MKCFQHCLNPEWYMNNWSIKHLFPVVITYFLPTSSYPFSSDYSIPFSLPKSETQGCYFSNPFVQFVRSNTRMKNQGSLLTFQYLAKGDLRFLKKNPKSNFHIRHIKRKKVRWNAYLKLPFWVFYRQAYSSSLYSNFLIDIGNERWFFTSTQSTNQAGIFKKRQVYSLLQC